MSAFTLRWRWGLALIGALSVVVLAGGLTQAAKPGGGLGGPEFESRGFWRMNTDGTGKQLRYGPENKWDLSRGLHGGHRWFLATGPSLSDSRYWALFAVRDDGHPDFIVQLVDETSLPVESYFGLSRWGKDDSFIGFSAWDALNNVGEVWAADVAFDDATGVPALIAPPVLLAEEPQADLSGFDFSPLGDQVVYQLNTGDSSNAPLVIKDLVIGDSRLLPAEGVDPLWSPDGTRIAFAVVDAGIHAINPDGSGLVKLSNVMWGDYMGDWSPDGKHLVFTRLLRKSRGGYSVYSADILSITVASGSTVNLTKDIDGTAWAAFWR